jgi:hypothetical protein
MFGHLERSVESHLKDISMSFFLSFYNLNLSTQGEGAGGKQQTFLKREVPNVLPGWYPHPQGLKLALH